MGKEKLISRKENGGEEKKKYGGQEIGGRVFFLCFFFSFKLEMLGMVQKTGSQIVHKFCGIWDGRTCAARVAHPIGVRVRRVGRDGAEGGNQSTLGSNLYCPGPRQTQGVGRPYEVSTSCDLDRSGARESTATGFLPVNALLTGQLRRDTTPDPTPWRCGVEVNGFQAQAK